MLINYLIATFLRLNNTIFNEFNYIFVQTGSLAVRKSNNPDYTIHREQGSGKHHLQRLIITFP